jgi:enoyl-CoA hydratase/carnithine racemase
MNSERVSIEVEAGVADVRLVRGDKHNALDQDMFLAIREAQEHLRGEAGVRVVVLSGDGPSFCSGLDLAAVAAGGFDPGMLIDRPEDEVANLAQTASYGWRSLPVPVIAAVHGACFGGGLQIALGADIRIAAPDARLSVMEIKLGLVPDMAISAALPRLVREDVAKELTFSGRIVDGTEAAALGLVTRVADPHLDAALELGAELAARSPEAIRAIKRLFNESWQQPPEVTLRLETELVRPLFGTHNQMEAARAALAKDQPVFVDPPLALGDAQ